MAVLECGEEGWAEHTTFIGNFLGFLYQAQKAVGAGRTALILFIEADLSCLPAVTQWIISPVSHLSARSSIAKSTFVEAGVYSCQAIIDEIVERQEAVVQWEARWNHIQFSHSPSPPPRISTCI